MENKKNFDRITFFERWRPQPVKLKALAIFATFLELSNLTKLKALAIFPTKHGLKEVTTKKIPPKITTLATKTKNHK